MKRNKKLRSDGAGDGDDDATAPVNYFDFDVDKTDLVSCLRLCSVISSARK